MSDAENPPPEPSLTSAELAEPSSPGRVTPTWVDAYQWHCFDCFSFLLRVKSPTLTVTFDGEYGRLKSSPSTRHISLASSTFCTHGCSRCVSQSVGHVATRLYWSIGIDEMLRNAIANTHDAIEWIVTLSSVPGHRCSGKFLPAVKFFPPPVTLPSVLSAVCIAQNWYLADSLLIV